MFFVPVMYLVMSTLSPGPVTVLTIQNTTRYGRSAGTAVAMGGALTTAVFVGIAMMLTGGRMVDVSLHTANLYQQGGAVFTLVMGLITGYKSLFGQAKSTNEAVHSHQIFKSFLTGMGLMIPYFPQAILFYTVILPHHAAAANLDSSILAMGLIKIAITLAWYSVLSLAAKSIQEWFFNPRTQRYVELVVACFLVGMSVTLLVE